MSFVSQCSEAGQIAFPEYQGVRCMMMPFRFFDRGSIPIPFAGYRRIVDEMLDMSGMLWMTHEHFIGYLTVDEAFVRAGETHRRPGLHVDGVVEDGSIGGWGGGGGGWAAKGMLTAANRVGCRGWRQLFEGEPKPNGDCSHLASELRGDREFLMKANSVYSCNSHFLHEAVPMQEDTLRQFIRISMPSNAPWYEGYTRNPMGIEPTGPIHPARIEFMSFRP